MEFALLGHQEHWDAIGNLLESGTGRRLEEEALHEIYPWIPPRCLGRIHAKSILEGCEASGNYIETFISPSELAQSRNKSCLSKLRRAAEIAAASGAKVAGLGGFTSIALEGDLDSFQDLKPCAFTTGNSLTTALIVKGVEEAAKRFDVSLNRSKLLVFGSCGDIGSACARYFAPRVSQLLLCGRHFGRLQEQARSLSQTAFSLRAACDLRELLPSADIVIFAASLDAASLSLENAKPGAILCDAGYPKNCLRSDRHAERHYFHGGMGQMLGGYTLESAFPAVLKRYPAPDIAHGCLLEAVLLALEGRSESFSTGRGQINKGKIQEIWSLAQRHGIVLAPFHDQEGLWPKERGSFVH